MARQAVNAEQNLENSCYDGEKKGWKWDKYAALQKEQHTVMKSLEAYEYREINNST